MEGPTSFGRLTYGSVDKMASRVAASNVQGLMVRTFPRYVCARIKGMTIQMYSDRNTLYQQLFDIFGTMRTMVRDQAAAAPDASNVSKRALGVRKANLPDLGDFADKLKAMIGCQALELGLNQPHEAACALYIRQKPDQAVVDNFVGDEYVGSERKLPLKERMSTSVKEVQKLSTHAKATVGVAGGHFSGKKKVRGGGGSFKQPATKGGSLPPRFDKLKAVAREHADRRNDIQCLKCKEMEHFAKDCPSKCSPLV